MASLESPEEATKSFTYSAGSYDRIKSNEEELFDLVKLSEVPIDKELFKVILELLKLNVAPAAILQVLKSLRSQNTPDDIGSRSPILQHSSSGSSRHHTPPPPLSSDNSAAHLPPAMLINLNSLSSGGGGGGGGELAVKKENDRGSVVTKEGGREKLSSNKQRSHDHKRKTKTSSSISSGGGVRSHDPTGGSAKLKIRDYHSIN